MRWQSGLAFFFSLVGMVGSTLGQETARLSPLDNRPGWNAVYELRFVAADTLSSRARFEVILPAGFDVSGVQLASSRIMDGGFAVKVAQDTVRIFRSGEGKSLPPGTAIDLLFAAVKNPKELPSALQATVRVFGDSAAPPQVLMIAVSGETIRAER
jgi:hypothetical protein